MDCREYQERITAAIDNALEEQERASLDAHLLKCPACKNEFEIERLARNIVKARCKRVPTPGHVLNRITNQLAAELAPRGETPLWRKIMVSRYFRPAIGFAFACIVVILLVTDNSGRASNDVIRQSLANYAAFAGGKIKPQLVSDNSDHLMNFFYGKTEFPVLVPRMNGCKLVGGVLDDFSGMKLAHVLYNRHDSEIVYVYETCWQTVQSGKLLHLADDIQEELKNTGWYSASQPDGYTVMMWTKGKTLCTAVAKMNREALLSCVSPGQ